MAKKKPAQKPALSEAPLDRCLSTLLPIVEQGGPYLGHGERAQGIALVRRLRSRIEVEDAGKLAVEATNYINIYGPHIEQARAGILARQAEAEAVEAEHLRARLTREADIQARIDAAEERRMREMARDAIDEVL